MALPPTIPTSFVPKQPVSAAAHKRTSGANPFLALSYFILGLAVLASAAVFAYQFYLEGVIKKKANDVTVAQQKIDQATVSNFIRLRDRFTAARGLLDHHVALSQFFDELESITLQGVSFKRLSVTVKEDYSATIALSGTARSFNALAAQSTVFATNRHIKRAIFSGITSQPEGIGFDVRAELDPSIVIEQPPASASAQAAPAAPTTPATSSPATTTP